jgi:hypothetical protein
MKQRKRKRKPKGERKQNGICLKCSNAALPGKSLCQQHRERKRQRRRQGICHDCPKPSLPGKSRCQRHSEKTQLADRRRYARYRVAGLCAHCGHPALQGKSMCAKHRKHSRALPESSRGNVSPTGPRSGLAARVRGTSARRGPALAPSAGELPDSATPATNATPSVAVAFERDSQEASRPQGSTGFQDEPHMPPEADACAVNVVESAPDEHMAIGGGLGVFF